MTGALILQMNSQKLVNKVKELLSKVGLTEEDWKKYPSQLSSDEVQRVRIIRTIINDLKILFADEPSGALNSAFSCDLLDIFTEVHKNGKSIVMVTHDIKAVLKGIRVLYLLDGVVFGDYKMPSDYEDDVKERRTKLSGFLEFMGW